MHIFQSNIVIQRLPLVQNIMIAYYLSTFLFPAEFDILLVKLESILVLGYADETLVDKVHF